MTIGSPVAGLIVVIAMSVSSSCLWMEHGRGAWQRRDAPPLSPPAPGRFWGMAWAWEVCDRRHAMLGWLGKELHELEHLRRHLVGDRESKLVGFRDADRIIVRPGAFREHPREVGGLLGGVVLRQEFEDTLLHLSDGLLCLIREDEGRIIDLRHGLFFQDLQNRGRGRLASLGIHGAEYGMSGHHNLVCSQGD